MDRRTIAVASVFVVGVVTGTAISGALGVYFLDVDLGLGGEQAVADVESHPKPPERPATLSNETVSSYAVSFEERRLYNDVLAEHSNRLVGEERVVNVCRPRSVRETADGFQVELSCAGGIDNRDDDDRRGGFEYSVTYRVTETATKQVGIERFPYEERSPFNDTPAASNGKAA